MKAVKMSDFEGYGKIFISTLMGAALGITITYSTGVASNRTEIVRLATKIESLTSTIAHAMDDRYKGADAARDFGVIRNQIRDIQLKDKELENEFKEHLRDNEG